MTKIAKSKSVKRRIKIMTVPTPEPEVPKEVENVLASLLALQASNGWAIIVKILNDNIAMLEKAILEKVNPLTKTLLSDAEVEKFRERRELNIELRDMPVNYSKVLTDTEELPQNFDPYYKENSDIIKESRKI